MNPIPTTKAMNPAPGKGITSFPTPVLNDVIVAEIVNAWKGDYQALEYGTKWDDVPHGSQQVSRPDHKLVFQTTVSEDGQWVRRIWANDRVDQDTYNYAIKYSGGSPDHPIYIRTYVEPRDTYAPLPDNTPDPVYPSALLVEEEVVRQQNELDSEYVQVVRVYETIPGPAITSKRVNERGDTETIVTQVVPPGTDPDPDGLLVTGTQVQQEDTSKGVKTISTVESHSQLETKDKKDGLLGETTTTEDIVDPSTTPDTLSTSVIASTVQQISATKAVKRTTTATGPTSLTQKNKDGKLLGDITTEQSIVAPNTAPDNPDSSILASEVRQTDSGKAIKTNTVLNSTPTLEGGQSDSGLLGKKTITESIVPAGTQPDNLSETIISSSVDPIDSIRSRKQTVESTGPTSLIGSRLNERGDTETIEEKIVAAGTNPDPDAFLQTSSFVEPIDEAKSKKTTTTVDNYSQLETKDKKDGLLGETTTTEDIVDPTETPDALSTTVIASTVQQISATKAIKRTTNLTGPSSLSRKSKDGKLLGNTTTTQSVVAPNSSPDEVSESVLVSEVNQVDSGKAIKTNVVLNSTPTLEGEQREPGLLGKKTTTELVVPAGTQADALTETILSSIVEPIDSVRSRKQTIESTGPTSLVGSRINERGDTETIEESIVSAGTNPDPDALLQTSSSVEPIDEAKSKKTTSTVAGYSQLETKDKKDGLLGETTTTEDIVDPTETPDALSTTVIASTVQQISATKAVKRTTTASAPTSLEQKSKDGKLIGDVTITESIVPPNATPDAPSGIDSGILSSEIRQIDSGKAIKRNTVLNSTPRLLGSDTKGGLLGETSIEESVVASGTAADAPTNSIISSTVEPIDSSRSRKVTVTAKGPTSLSGTEKREGLLGETTVTESIVAAGSVADPLSQTVISSSVQPIDSAKSKKTTITSSGPTSLTQKSNDGKLLGDVTATESVVAPGASPDALSSLVLSSEVRQTDSGKAIKRNVVLNSTPTLTGGDLKGGLLGETSIEQSIVDAGESPDPLSLEVISSTVTPIDSQRGQKTTIRSSGPITLLGSRINERGDTETIEESIVDAGTNPDPDSFLQKSSSVEPIDEAKSKKTTSTVDGYSQFTTEDKKEGLLGETTTTEDIVDPTETPDALSTTVIASTVQQISSTKAVKRTTTASGPTSLTQTSNDGKLLGNVTATESIVDPGTSPDAVSDSVLSSEVRQIDNGKAIKRNVVLNSTPELSGNENKGGLLGETTVTESIVSSGEQADTLTTEIISSSVEPIDSVRSRKITITSSGPTELSGAERKAGLLGNTTVEESIVSAGTKPDALSETVISSSVEPIDSAKSRKITVTSSGPKVFTQRTTVNSPLGLIDATETRSILTSAPESVGGFNIVSDEVQQIDEAKFQQNKVEVSSWPELKGSQYDEVFGIALDYQEEIIDATIAPFISEFDEDYTPIDKWKTRKRTYDRTRAANILLQQFYQLDTQVNVTLPDKLLSAEVYWSKAGGKGATNEEEPTVTGDSYSYSESYEKQSSASVSGDVFFKVEKGYSGPVPGREYIFFLRAEPGEGVSGSVISKINSFGNNVKDWPRIKQVSENIVIIGGSSTFREGYSKTESKNINGSSRSDRETQSYSLGTEAKSVLVPPSIHGNITINEQELGSFEDAEKPPRFFLRPGAIGATSPSQFPSGEYLVSSNMEIFKWGLVKVSAKTAIVNGYT